MIAGATLVISSFSTSIGGIETPLKNLLANSWMIGDSNGDVQAGKAAGCHTIRIATGILGSNETMADYQAADLLHAIQRILKNHEKADLLPVSPPLIGLPAFEYDISWLPLD